MASAQDFSKQVNSEMRRGRGVVVDSYSVPPEHKAVNDFIRREAARNTFETNVASGQVTHVDGEPVEDRGEGRR